MKRAPFLFTLRLCLAFLPVLMLLAGTGAQAFAQAAEATVVVICSDGAMKTLRIGADGTADHDPQDCRDCPACLLPPAGGLAQASDPGHPADWRPALYPRPITAALLIRKSPAPLSRGPPPPSPWLNA